MKQSDIEKGLSALGLKTGDIVLLHSSLASFGHVEGGAECVVEAFLNVLGASGTLVVPTFGALGIITETVSKDPRAIHSVHPLASVAAIGADAEALCANHWEADTAHGEDTPYMRIAERGGYVCLAGVDQDRNTTLHTVEALLKLPYLATRTESFSVDGGPVTSTWHYFPGPHRDFIGLDPILRERNVMRMGRIGDSVIRLMKSRELIDVCLEIGRANPAFVLCDNPHCADCVRQRTALRRARIEEEAFVLAAASGLAGSHLSEMVENLRATGIRHVELDILEGRPAHTLPPSTLTKTVEELLRNGCQITGLRCPTVPLSVETLFDWAASCGVGRVLLPHSAANSKHAAMAAQAGVTLSLFNSCEHSATVSEALVRLRDTDTLVGFTFSGASFALTGEHPFLFSYKQKLRRFVDQLDLEDVCFDGTVQPLACGNAEIKEMISILRCARFSGPMVLTSKNRQVGDLRDAVARFEALLAAM